MSLHTHQGPGLIFFEEQISESPATVCGNLADKFLAEVLTMKDAVGFLTLVVMLAGIGIWSVLSDIRKALQEIVGDSDLPDGKLDALVDKLDAVVREQNRIGDILGGILADMPREPREVYQPPHRPDSERFRATNEERNELGSFKVVDRRVGAADTSPDG